MVAGLPVSRGFDGYISNRSPYVVKVGGAEGDVLRSTLVSMLAPLAVAGTIILTTWLTRTTRRRREF